MAERLTVFFDGGCPLCRREIDHYRRIEPPGLIRWIDVSREREDTLTFGLDPRDAMAVFHVRTADGQWQTGAAAFVRLWQELPYYRALGWLCEHLHLTPLLDRVYRRFARWRFAKRCRDGDCGV